MKVPDAVMVTYARLRNEYKFYIALELINGNYYVYRHRSIWNKANKKRRTESEYLGKITLDGAFIKKSMSKEEKEVEISKAVIEAHGGKIVWESQEKTEMLSTDELDKKILVELSTDAREPVTEISKKLGVSETIISNRIKKLEDNFGIKYTIDTTLRTFYHYQFVALVKFLGGKPDMNEVAKLLAVEPRIRLALSTRGAYDLIIFMFVNEPLDAEDIIYKLRSNTLLSVPKAIWHVSYNSQSYGFIPLRDEFLELIRERVWKRTKESSKKAPEQFFYREYATLKELNKNSTISFNRIDQKHGLKNGSAQNTYRKLLENETIRSSTITMSKPPIKDTVVFVLKQLDIEKFNKNKKEYFKYRLVDEDALLNKFLFSGDLGSPYGLLLMAPTYKNGDLERLEKELVQEAKGTVIQTSIVSDIIVGNLGYRKIDNTKTHLYKKLLEMEE